MSTYRSKSNFTAWAIVAIIGLLGLNAYQWFMNSQLRNQNIAHIEEVDELGKIRAELEHDYQSALESLEDMRGENKNLDALIDSQKAELAAQKKKINNLIWTKRELNKAKDEIKNLNTMAAGYLAEISKLREDNEFLTSQNSQLVAKTQTLTQEVESERQAREEIAQARAILASEKEELAKSNTKLSTKVDMANAIKINYMEVQGYAVSDNGKIKKKRRARNVDMLRMCFKTETNLVTPAGEKDFYFRIISPQGVTIAVEDKGSGVITNKLNNSQVRYTTSGTIEYKNEDTEACVDWVLDDRLAKGVYDIEMYNNGFLVGNGSFKLK